MNQNQTPNPTEKPETDLVLNDSTNPYAVERLKNIRNTQPGQEDAVGKETVGTGMPSIQKVENEESVPATAVPVEQNFTKTGEFYSPRKDEDKSASREAADRGATKTSL